MMPLPDICNECDKMVSLLDWRGLCDKCSEKEDEDEL
jgi:Zn finger protein HypA/HybF involved in hydrogenase expression